MSGFSPEWLALREPVDHRTRNSALARQVADLFKARAGVSVTDLGCGAGSNIRATFRLLPATQSWTLVDYDARLLVVARERLMLWAERVEVTGETLKLDKEGKRLTVAFRQADLTKDLDAALGAKPDLVTASALFDLCSADFIATFAKAVTARRAAFYTVLSYNGIQTWTPAHAADAAMAAAFHAHQRTDKGFGASAGPDAPKALSDAFRAAGANVAEGDSPWVLGGAEQRLIDDLSGGFADAVAEHGAVPAAMLAAWRAVWHDGAVVGHTDTLAW